MPRYDFQCPECETTFEVARPASERDAPSCPDCGEEAKRVFTPVGVVFKGSGFHSTDYPTKTPAEPTAADEKSSESTSKTDDKPCPASGSSESCGSCPAASDS
jgi:putative FmdB family regulatory protein